MGYMKELGLRSMLKEVPLDKGYLLCHIRNAEVHAQLAPTDNWPADLQLFPVEKTMGLGGILWSIFSDRDMIGDSREPGWPHAHVRSKYGDMNFRAFLEGPHRVAVPSTGEFKDYTPSPGAIELIRPWFAWWDDLDKLSALAMIQYGVTGQRLCEPRDKPVKWFRTRKGMEYFPLKFENKLRKLGVKIRKKSPVLSIRHDGESVTVTYRAPSGQRKETQGNHVVSAIPLTTLRKVTVTPPLPESKRTLIQEVRYASVARAYIQCKQRITDLKNGAGYTDLPIGNLLDMSFGLKNGPGRLFQSFMIGEQARRFAAMNDKRKKTFTLEHLTIVFPQLRDIDVQRFTYKCWDDDPWALGAYPVFSPEQFLAIEELGKAEGLLHFAGEHTSQHSAWMEGALRSGIRAAREIDSSVPERT
jgi:predicted NAD/FAD-dependent oxidoreductase